MSNNQRITELEAKLSQLQQELDAIKNSPKEWPQVGDYYWYVTSDGYLTDCSFSCDELDEGAESIGNMFQTREEAEAELHARLTIAKLRSQPGRKKFVVGEDNWCVDHINFESNEFGTDRCVKYNNGFASTYFESSEAAENAIKAVGADNILKAARWLAMG